MRTELIAPCPPSDGAALFLIETDSISLIGPNASQSAEETHEGPAQVRGRTVMCRRSGSSQKIEVVVEKDGKPQKRQPQARRNAVPRVMTAAFTALDSRGCRLESRSTTRRARRVGLLETDQNHRRVIDLLVRR